MELDRAKLSGIDAEVREATALAPYQAVNGLWVCLVKFANLLPTVGEEHEQVASPPKRFTRRQAAFQLAQGVGVAGGLVGKWWRDVVH